MKRLLVEIIYFLFILLFIYASLNKLLTYHEFEVQLGKSPLLTDYAHWMAWVVPFIEIIISSILVIPRLRLQGLYAAVALMTAFTVYIYIIMNYSEHIPCSCGGVLQKMTWSQHLVFNVGFLALGIFGVFLETYQQQRRAVTKNFQYG